MKRFIVDTHAWMGYFDSEERFRKWIEENVLETPASVLAEISMVLARRGIPENVRNQVMETISGKSLILPLEAAHAKAIGSIVLKEKLHYADALVYAYASKEKQVLTGDPHFKGKENVLFVEQT
ncbi:PIN domain-containing protein [Candidatus Micrarchaeota archaeon]|nr:PIN domain-containing protein [Candidatus Micrarchaeota archaeon]